VPIDVITQYLGNKFDELNIDDIYTNLVNIAPLLNVVKYEPPDDISSIGLIPFVAGMSKYDIENAEYHADLVHTLLDEPVMITEKLEGSHFAATVNGSGEITVSQRNYSIDNNTGYEHVWYKAFYEMEMDKQLGALQSAHYPGKIVTFRGEIVGPKIQSNYYQLEEHSICLFDIQINGEYVDVFKFIELVDEFNLCRVPIVSYNIKLGGYLNGDSLSNLSYGQSALNPKKLREGIVIRPMREIYHSEIDRAILKQRDPVYLDKTER
jgi:RNA ligase (TIGR02306 family)